MKKNEKFIGTCESYTYDGLGIVKYNNLAIFVKDMMVHETGEIIITKILKNYGYGRCLSKSVVSQDRIEPACSIYKQCGGCQIAHMSYEAQKQFKRERVQNCMTKIGGFNHEVKDVLGMDHPVHYRNKAQIPVGLSDNQIKCGFYRIHSNEIIDMNECLIQHPYVNELLFKFKQLLNKFQNGDCFRHLFIKVGFASQEVMVVFVAHHENIPHLEEMVEEFSQFPYVKSIILNINDKVTNVVLGQKEILLYGAPTITDTLKDLKFHISSKSFYQVNPIQTVTLYDKAVEFAQLTGNETVLDLYCGIGTISLFMAKKAKKVLGIEIVEAAIEDAKKNAQLNGIENVEFYCSDAGTFAKKLANENRQLDVICVDPPRKGCDEAALSSMIVMNPKRIVYVSCDPATLARDCKYLCANGYEIKEIQPVDMFPNSYHIETVVLLSRKDK